MKIGFFLVLTLNLFCFQNLPDWDKNQIDREEESIPIDCYSTSNVRKCSESLKELGNLCSLVEILNGSIYINGDKQSKLHITDELALCLIRICEQIPLPNCVFLYMHSSIFNDCC